jgi:hypothetical protein
MALATIGSLSEQFVSTVPIQSEEVPGSTLKETLEPEGTPQVSDQLNIVSPAEVSVSA